MGTRLWSIPGELHGGGGCADRPGPFLKLLPRQAPAAPVTRAGSQASCPRLWLLGHDGHRQLLVPEVVCGGRSSPGPWSQEVPPTWGMGRAREQAVQGTWSGLRTQQAEGLAVWRLQALSHVHLALATSCSCSVQIQLRSQASGPPVGR